MSPVSPGANTKEADHALASNSPASVLPPACLSLVERVAGGGLDQKVTEATFEQVVVEPEAQIRYVKVPPVQTVSVWDPSFSVVVTNIPFRYTSTAGHCASDHESLVAFQSEFGRGSAVSVEVGIGFGCVEPGGGGVLDVPYDTIRESVN